MKSLKDLWATDKTAIAIGGLILVFCCLAAASLFSLVTAPTSTANEQLPDAAQFGILALPGAIAAALAAFSIGLQRGGHTMEKPAGYPKGPLADAARLINAYNVVKERSSVPPKALATAQYFAIDHYLRAVMRRPLNAPPPPLPDKRKKKKDEKKS